MPVVKRRHERTSMTERLNSKYSKVIKGKNISLSGICVKMENKMDIADIIDVEFNLSGNSNKFTARTKVIWQVKSDEDYFTRLEFTNISVVQLSTGA